MHFYHEICCMDIGLVCIQTQTVFVFARSCFHFFTKVPKLVCRAVEKWKHNKIAY